MIGGVWLVLQFDARKRGAMEEQLVALAGRLRDERVPTTMVFARPPAAFPGGDLRALGVDVRHVSFSAPAQALNRLAGWFVAERPALVHFHFVDAYSRYVQAAKVAGAQTMVHDHLPLEPAVGVRGVYERLRGALLNLSVDRRVAVSAYVAETVRRAHGVRKERLEVVENAVDLDRFASADGTHVRAELGLGDAPLVISPARLGGDELIRAMGLLDWPAHLAFLGEGSKQSEWGALAARLGLASRTHFLGLRSDVEQVLAAATLVVAPSRGEAESDLHVIEALAAARPVILTGPGPMAAVAGDAGVVVPEHDAVALAGAIARLLSDAGSARALAARGRARVRARYGMEAYVEAMTGAYRRLVPWLAVRPGRAGAGAPESLARRGVA